MPVTILSWNIQNLGASKAQNAGVPPTQREIVDVVLQMIDGTGADIVGIMEVQSGIGPWLTNLLVTRLNEMRANTAPFAWRGVYSARQSGGTDEEYIYLWKDEPGVLTLDPAGRPGPVSTVGVVDAQALAGFQQRAGLTDAQVVQLMGALEDSGYIRRMGTARENAVRARPMRMVPGSWWALSTGGVNAAVEFDGRPARQPPPLTDPQRRDLAQVLLDVDILRFLGLKERSPYLANFRVGNPPRPLLVALYHALGPSDHNRFSANNVIALSRPIVQAAAAGNLLLMGDFNISADQMRQQCRAYERLDDPPAYFATVRPPQMAGVFAPIVGAPLNARDLLGVVKTSVRKYYWPAAEPYPNLLASEYDKFFLRSAPAPAGLAAQAPAVVPALPMLSSTGPGHDPNLAGSAMRYYRAFRGLPWVDCDRDRLQADVDSFQRNLNYWNAQLARANAQAAGAYGGAAPPAGSVLGKRTRDYTAEAAAAALDLAGIQAEMADLLAFRAMVANPVVQAPAGSGPALNVYRDAVSDHLPILVTLV